MKKTLSIIIPLLFIMSFIFAQEILKEFTISIDQVKQAVVAEPNSSKLIVKSKIPELRFESNRGIKKVEKIGDGEWKLTLYPGSQKFEIKAQNFISYSERITFEKQKVYECNVKEKSEQLFSSIGEDLFEVSFKFNASEVNCSFNEYASNLSSGNNVIFKLPAGEYTFHFSKGSYRPVARTIAIKGDNTYNINLVKDSGYQDVYKSPGIIVIMTNPGNAEIILDGQKFGYTPANISGISQGEHKLEIIKNKYYSNLSTFTIKEGEIKNLDINLRPKFGYLNITSHPDSCEILMDGQWVGYTPINRFEYESGKYTLTGKKTLYHDYILGGVEIQENESKTIEFELKPAFGTLKINSSPESNAEVKINGQVVGRTPFNSDRFPSGNFTLELRKEYFNPIKENITVIDGKTTSRNFILNSKYGTLTVKSDNARLYLNDEIISQNQNNIKLLPGTYTLRAQKEHYYTNEKEIIVYAGKTETININLIPIQGSVSIMIEPLEYQKNSEIFINGVSYGHAPIIQKLTVGEYKVDAYVQGKVYSQPITVKENQDNPIKFNVNNLQAVVPIIKDKMPSKKSTGTTVTDIDGNVYKTVKIGNQVWMAENLKVTHYRNGDSIPLVENNKQWRTQKTGAYCNYDNKLEKASVYGRLYNWYATVDSRNLAPLGWHIASNTEWQVLINHLGRSDKSGGKLKEVGYVHWSTPNSGASNQGGFKALPGGLRSAVSGKYNDMGFSSIFWSRNTSSSLGKTFKLVYSDPSIVGGVYFKASGFSIRCIKD